MSELKCVRDAKTKHVYCCDPITGKLYKYPAPQQVNSDSVPPCVLEALLAGGSFVLEIEDAKE